jgi:hypothetical protein
MHACILPRILMGPYSMLGFLESSAIHEIANHIQGNLGLVSGNHMSSVVHLQKGQSLGRTGKSLILPAVFFGTIKGFLTVPLQLERPRLVTEVVADEINITSVHQGRNTRVQEIRNIRRKILHPVGAERSVNSEVALGPRMRMLFVHTQGLFGRLEVEKLLNVAKVVAQRRVLALFANIVRVQTRHLVWTGEAHVANQKGRLASKIIEKGVTLVALGNERSTGINSRLHGVVGSLVHYLDTV